VRKIKNGLMFREDSQVLLDAVKRTTTELGLNERMVGHGILKFALNVFSWKIANSPPKISEGAEGKIKVLFDFKIKLRDLGLRPRAPNQS
jgi:hypothetical protein